MSFMQPEVFEDDYFEVETTEGTEIVPASVAGDIGTVKTLSQYVNGFINPSIAIEKKHGWLARLTAPGYLDRTDWNAYKSEAEAREGLDELFDVDDDQVLTVPGVFDMTPRSL